MLKSQNSKTIYDLDKRTLQFGKNIIQFCKNVPQSIITRPLISQLVRSGTSVGANYHEADDAESKKDFKHKIGICKKESRESKYFINMIAVAVPGLKSKAQPLWNEARELNLIFNSIFKKVK